MHSHASITTLESKRIAKRLLNHWKHKFEVSEVKTVFSIFMPEAIVLLDAQPEHLNILIKTQAADNSHLESVVLDHLNRMAQQEFQTTWTHQDHE